MKRLLVVLLLLTSAVYAGQRAVYLKHHSVLPGAEVRGLLLVADAAGVESFWESRRGMMERRPKVTEMRVDESVLNTLRLPEDRGSRAAAQDGAFELCVVGEDGKGKRVFLPETEGVETARRMMAPLPPELLARAENELLQPAQAAFARRKPVAHMRRELYPLLLGMDGFEGWGNVTWADGAVRRVKMVFTDNAADRAFSYIPYAAAVGAFDMNRIAGCRYAPVVYAVGEFSPEPEVLCRDHGEVAPVLYVHSLFLVLPYVEGPTLPDAMPDEPPTLHDDVADDKLRPFVWRLALPAAVGRLPGLYPVCGMNAAEGTVTLAPATAKGEDLFSCRVVFEDAEQGAAFFTPEQEQRVTSCTQGAPALYLIGTYDAATNTLHAARFLPNADPRSR